MKALEVSVSNCLPGMTVQTSMINVSQQPLHNHAMPGFVIAIGPFSIWALSAILDFNHREAFRDAECTHAPNFSNIGQSAAELLMIQQIFGGKQDHLLISGCGVPDP